MAGIAGCGGDNVVRRLTRRLASCVTRCTAAGDDAFVRELRGLPSSPACCMASVAGLRGRQVGSRLAGGRDTVMTSRALAGRDALCGSVGEIRRRPGGRQVT